MIYVKLVEEPAWEESSSFGTRAVTGMTTTIENKNQNNTSRRQRKISQSLALEKGMISRLHLVGVVPAP